VTVGEKQLEQVEESVIHEQSEVSGSDVEEIQSLTIDSTLETTADTIVGYTHADGMRVEAKISDLLKNSEDRREVRCPVIGEMALKLGMGETLKFLSNQAIADKVMEAGRKARLAREEDQKVAREPLEKSVKEQNKQNSETDYGTSKKFGTETVSPSQTRQSLTHHDRVDRETTIQDVVIREDRIGEVEGIPVATIAKKSISAAQKVAELRGGLQPGDVKVTEEARAFVATEQLAEIVPSHTEKNSPSKFTVLQDAQSPFLGLSTDVTTPEMQVWDREIVTKNYRVITDVSDTVFATSTEIETINYATSEENLLDQNVVIPEVFTQVESYGESLDIGISGADALDTSLFEAEMIIDQEMAMVVETIPNYVTEAVTSEPRSVELFTAFLQEYDPEAAITTESGVMQEEGVDEPLPLEGYLKSFVDSLKVELQNDVNRSNHETLQHVQTVLLELERYLANSAVNIKTAEVLPKQIQDAVYILIERFGYINPESTLNALLKRHCLEFLLHALRYIMQLYHEEYSQEFLGNSALIYVPQLVKLAHTKIGRLVLTYLGQYTPALQLN
jgi:hypothetical protein